MPIRFSTEAANADRIDPDAAPQASRPRGPASPRRYEVPGKKEAAKPVAGKPGEDINAAGFLKDPSPSRD
ncbi:hypothetical protein [Caenimonas aquaedulcis]|uniref:Uncharacterized protein n=1 Tax=Caenimonas aquaedulcis TaxID=2793270 RepID=A0A931H1T0_9BURK|nr:hypothetical protein [Caenimonas aquaedulcis]MBG9387024.1 hypothetical protein [Caenimonas aquaedulcis]